MAATVLNSIWKNPSDLAPGDRGSSDFNWSGFEVTKIESPSDPLFALAYQKLWDEFGIKGELESEETLARRMKWDPKAVLGDHSFFYEMILVRKDGNFAAVRDHTAIVSHQGSRTEAFVHLSHVLVDPTCRGSGLIGWLRAWPIQAARTCLLGASGKITLVAEMEPNHPDFSDRLIRLRSYAKAGFLKIDPALVDFYQPDFRPPHEIDASGGPQPLPLQLVVRRVHDEENQTLTGADVKRMVTALYQMYGAQFRPKDMAVVWNQLKTKYPNDETLVRLVDPKND